MNLPATPSNAFRLLLGVALLSVGATRLDAQSTWGTSPANGQMTNDANWLGGVAPSDSSAWVFTNSSITTVTNGFTGRTVAGILFTANATNTTLLTAGGYTNSGNAFTLAGGITNQSTNDQRINNILTNNSSITLTNTTNGYITLAGTVSGNGSITAGAANANGRVVLTGNWSGYTGTFTWTTTGRFHANAASMSASADYVFNTNNNVWLTSANTNYTVGSIAGLATVANLSIGTNTFGVGYNNSSTTFAGNVSSNQAGLLNFAKVGTGTLTLSGTNTYAGSTTISNGVLRIGGGGTTGSISNTTSINLAGGSIAFNRSDNISQGVNFLTNGATITGTGGLIKLGIGTLTLNQANLYSGATTISAGTLLLSSSAALSNGTTVSVASGATLDLGGLSQQIAGLTGAGIVTNSSGTLTVSKASGSDTFSGSMRGAGNFVKTGAGTLILSGNNTFNGTTAVNEGTLVLNGSISGSGQLTVAAGAVLAGSGTINGPTIINGTLQPTAP